MNNLHPLEKILLLAMGNDSYTIDDITNRIDDVIKQYNIKAKDKYDLWDQLIKCLIKDVN